MEWTSEPPRRRACGYGWLQQLYSSADVTFPRSLIDLSSSACYTLSLVAMSKKSKRPQVPAAFHAELTEYSSLLRALRTRATADLTSHLTQGSGSLASAAPSDDAHVGDDGDDDEAYATEGPPPTESVRDFSSAAGSSRPSSPVHPWTPSKGKQRDTWTRWPLLAGDVHVPEWTLEDEVKALAVQHVKRSLSGLDASPDHAELLKDLDDDFANTILPQASLDALAHEVATYLSRILALIAAHKPPAAESMQNRFAPFCGKHAESLRTVRLGDGYGCHVL